MSRSLRSGSTVGVALLASAVASIDACGSRTGLEGSVGVAPAGSNDATTSDALPDDATLPELDVQHRVDGTVLPGCDADHPTLFVVGAMNELMSFDPPSLTFRWIGRLDCPGATLPNSMAVSRPGTAYMGTMTGQMYRVDTVTAACTPTSFAPGQAHFRKFGMGFASDENGATETFFISEQDFDNRGYSRGLARVDRSSFVIDVIGDYSPPLGSMELTGTGGGRLFGFALNVGEAGSSIVEIDPRTARVLAKSNLRVGTVDDAFAFAFWGGDFWLFNATTTGVLPPPSTVTRYRPSDGTVATMATAPIGIVGAGVSTCAPQ